MQQMLYCNVAALAVAGLLYYWRAYSHTLFARDRALRQRVAYLLWVMADKAE